ncbi:hypothetical protein C8R46DRAFT_815939, partial [Mycena filopes]
PDRDPATLCPYCDSVLPGNTSSTLTYLLDELSRHSTKDARPANPRGRKAPLAVYATLCARHNFEGELIPRAVEKGWPSTIDWDSLPERIVALKGILHSILLDP